MRRVVVALAGTVAVVVALLLYRSPPAAKTTVVAPLPTPAPTTSSPTVRVLTGAVAKAYQRRMGYVFGNVQVVITVRRGEIVALRTPLLPPDGDTGGRGTQPVTESITQFAVPVLKGEALRAQSAHIQSVSGATFTSAAFMQSLQSALVQASS